MTRHISLRTLYSIGFIFSLHTALILYSNSSFLEQFIPESYLGLLYSLGSVIAIFGVIMVPKMISRFGSKRTMLLLIITTVSICLVNAFVNNPYVIAAVFVILFSVNIMFFLSNDIIIDQVADQDSMGKTRGTYLTALNMGYVIAPTITGFVLARMGFSALYVIAAVILVPLLILVVSSQSYSHVHISKTQIWRDLGKLFKSRDLRNIVIANFLLQFFYAWMVIYTPVYLHEVLLVPWDTIGHLFSVMLLAFILTQIPLGRIADRWIGEKYLLIVGFITIAIATSLLFFLPHFTLPLLAMVLFFTRIGASCVEVMTESYFFKKVPKTEAGTMSIFRNTYPIAYIIAPIIGSLIIMVAPHRYLFLVLSIIMLIGIFVTIPIRNTQ